MGVIQEERRGMPDTRPLRDRVIDLVACSDTTPTRFFLMSFALAQGVAFYLNTECVNLYVACAYLAAVMSYQQWGLIFIAYALLKLWRVFDGKPRPNLAKVINGLGACLFGGFATVLVIARWPYWVLAVPYVVVAFAAIWVFARTAINAQRGFRSD